MARISKVLDQKIRVQSKDRCEYCLAPQNLLPYKLEIDHIYPQALGGETIEDNLWLCCRECNAHKARKHKVTDDLTGTSVILFNPRKDDWTAHFDFSPNKTEIIGKTAGGRATVAELQMNNIYQRTARSAWVDLTLYPAEVE